MDMSGFFISRLVEEPYTEGIWLLVVIFSICCHEYAHAWTALRQGDPTAAEQGHLTLNPLKQMGIFSLIMIALMGIAWGAVPVNPSRMRHKYSDALVSFAGPLMNLILFTGSLLVFTVTLYYIHDKGFQDQALKNVNLIFFTGAGVNLMLFLFNMLPLPILDGWGVFSYIFPRLKDIITGSEAIKAIYIIIILLFIFFFDWIMTFCIFGIFLAAHLLKLPLILIGL